MEAILKSRYHHHGAFGCVGQGFLVIVPFWERLYRLTHFAERHELDCALSQVEAWRVSTVLVAHSLVNLSDLWFVLLQAKSEMRRYHSYVIIFV